MLRERGEEFDSIVHKMIEELCVEAGRKILRISEPVALHLERYEWPGNLREMRNAIERAVIMAQGNKINLADLPAELRGQALAGSNESDGALQIGALVSMEQLEEAHIRKVLERTSNLAEAAQVLGIDQATLYRKRKKIGLE